jgi:hypothetical protein
MKNRLKRFFVAESKRPGNGNRERSDLAKIVAALNKTLSPYVNGKKAGGKAVIRCENKTVWINTHCLVTGESSIPS